MIAFSAFLRTSLVYTISKQNVMLGFRNSLRILTFFLNKLLWMTEWPSLLENCLGLIVSECFTACALLSHLTFPVSYLADC